MVAIAKEIIGSVWTPAHVQRACSSDPDQLALGTIRRPAASVIGPRSSPDNRAEPFARVVTPCR